MSLKDTLKKLMVREGNLSVSALAKITNIPQPTLHQLCFGTTEKPRKKTLDILASYFSISIDQLLGQEALPDKLSAQMKRDWDIEPTPILSWEDLYHWPDDIDLKNKRELILENNKSKLTFALEMIGSNMEPIFPNGCLLIFDANKVTTDKDCVLVYLKKEDQFAFKKIYYDGNAAYVKSINPEFNQLSTAKLSSQDKVIATLLEARIKF